MPHPGKYDARIRPLLDSFVTPVFRPPQRLLGGLCHYMLPRRRRDEEALDGRYDDAAIALMLEEIDEADARTEDFRIRLFGGGNMFARINKHKTTPVGRKSVAAARQLIRAHGLSFAFAATGGQLP